MFGLIGLLGDIKQFLLEWAVWLCAIGAVACYLGLWLAESPLGLVLPWLRTWKAALPIVGFALAVLFGYLQGLAHSSAHQRLAEAREQLRRANALTAAQEAELARRTRIQKETEAALLRLIDVNMEAEAAAARERAEIDDLEKSDDSVKDYLRGDVPPSLRRLLVRP